jgi:hypothetical protein
MVLSQIGDHLVKPVHISEETCIAIRFVAPPTVNSPDIENMEGRSALLSGHKDY